MAGIASRHCFVFAGTLGASIARGLVDPILKIKATCGNLFEPEFFAIDTNRRVEDVVGEYKKDIKILCLGDGLGSGMNPEVAAEAWLPKRDEFFHTMVGDPATVASATVIAPAGYGGTAAGLATPLVTGFRKLGIKTFPFVLTPPTVGGGVGACQLRHFREVVAQFENRGIPFFEARGNWIYDQAKKTRKMSIADANQLVIDQFRDAVLSVALCWTWGTMNDPADMGRVLAKRLGASPRLKFAKTSVVLGSDNPEQIMEAAVQEIYDHELYHSKKIVEVVMPHLKGPWTIQDAQALFNAIAGKYGDDVLFSKPAYLPGESGEGDDEVGEVAILFTTVTQLSDTQHETVPEFNEEGEELEREENAPAAAEGPVKSSPKRLEQSCTLHYDSFAEFLGIALRGKREESKEARRILSTGNPWELRSAEVRSKRDGGHKMRLFHFPMEQSVIGKELVAFGKEGYEKQKLPLLETLLALSHNDVSLSDSWAAYLKGCVELALNMEGQVLPRYIVREWYGAVSFESSGYTPERLREDSRWRSQWIKKDNSRARLLLLEVVLENLFGNEEVAKFTHEPEETRTVYQRAKGLVGEWLERNGVGFVRRHLPRFRRVVKKPAVSQSLSIVQPDPSTGPANSAPVPLSKSFEDVDISTPLQ